MSTPIYVTKSFMPPLEEYNKYIAGIFDQGVLTNQGPYVQELQQKLSAFLGVNNFHYVTNGTVALQLALAALDINDGEIITTPFSYVATTSSVLWQRCTPVFVDIEPNNFTIDVNKIESAITPNTRAIMAVHVFGYACDETDEYMPMPIYLAHKLAKRLTDERVKTPAQYYSFEWKSNYNLKLGEWHSKSIRDILTNQIYTGDLVQNRRSKVNYKVKKVIRNNPKDYIIVENTHEPIIDKEMFYEVQKRIPKNVGRNEKKEVHLLDGLLYCGDCGHRISVQPRRKKDNRCYTICNYYRTYIRQKFCTLHCNNYDFLEQVVLDTLKNYCLKYLDGKNVKERVLSNINGNETDTNQKEIKLLEQEINRINENLDDIYLDKLNKVINEEQFNRVTIKLENELKIKQEKLLKLLQPMKPLNKS